MPALDIRIGVTSKGVARVTALGRDRADRLRALAFIARILPALDQIDEAAKKPDLVEVGGGSDSGPYAV